MLSYWSKKKIQATSNILTTIVKLFMNKKFKNILLVYLDLVICEVYGHVSRCRHKIIEFEI